MDRRQFVAGASAGFAALTLPGSASRAQSQPIRIIYPFSPGNSGDALIRRLADVLRDKLGENVLVENRVGADGRIALRAVAQAEPDGRTFLFTPFGPIVLHPSVYDTLPYNPMTDLAPVSQLAIIDFCVVTGSMTGAKNLRELVAWSKANMAQSASAIPGAGTLPHFLLVAFAKAAGVEIRTVPYRGTAPALTDLVGGQIPMIFTTTADATPLHRDGKVRILATSGAKRSGFVPDVPTFQEQGFDLTGDSWYGLYAPAKTSPELITKVSKIVGDAARSPEFKPFLDQLGLAGAGSTPAELAKIQQADFERWAPVIKASGFKAAD